MSTNPAALRTYRVLLRLYPKRFRDEYGPDLLALVADQLRDEPSWRVASRTAVDLALTVPSRHLEAHMDRTPTLAVPVCFGAIALGAIVVALTVGHPVVFFVCLAVALGAIALGLLALHRARPMTEPRAVSAHWWKLLAGGAVLLAALVVITTATGELAEGTWFIAMLIGLLAVALIASGIVLGIIHVTSRSQRGFAG